MMSLYVSNPGNQTFSVYWNISSETKETQFNIQHLVYNI